MPGPPPPPPAAPPPMMPPPPVFNSASSKGGGSDDHSALLKSIRQGAKLKKTVTNDKSAPMIGKISNSVSSSNNVAGGKHTSHNLTASPMPNDLSSLFAGGMPKLRPTGRQLGGKHSSNHFSTSNLSNNLSSSNSINTRQNLPQIHSQTAKSFTSIQNELKKQMASDNRNRGPPPPAPVRNNSDLSNSRHHFVTKNGSANGLHKNISTTQTSSLYPNSSTLHRKANSSVNLSPVESVEPSINNNLPVKPVINHGKPHLAPKPPLNGKPAAPPKKLIMNGKPISRAQSMKSPRSPSPQSPDNITAAIKFGTVRNLTAVVNQSLANSTGNLSSSRPRPPIATRPNAPPPSIPHNVQPPPPPSKISMVKPPNHAPPPPPNAPLPQPPNHAPPLPPHRTGPVRGAPAVPHSNNTVAPPPPPRHSSIRDANSTMRRPTPHYVDLEIKFAKEFHSVSQFPKPGPYIGFFKSYRSKQVGNKQQAPQPPNHLQVSNKTWNTSSC